MEVNSLKTNERIAALEDKGATILWTNPNPNQEFSSQIITLSSDDYDFLDFFFALGVDETGRSFRIHYRLIRGFNGEIVSMSNGVSTGQIEMRRRTIGWVSYNQFNFGDCLVKQAGTTAVGTTNNTFLIAQQIYGIKSIK